MQSAEPPGTLYRIARAPDPLAYPPHEYAGGERYDDPKGGFRVLKTAETRRACFVEGLARFRQPLRLLAGQLEASGLGVQRAGTVGAVPRDWYLKRFLGRLRILPGQQWLDIGQMATREALRPVFAPLLVSLGLPDLDVAAVCGPERALTQSIARWAYERGYQGIAYRSRLESAYTCWAIFEGAAFEPVGDPEVIRSDDPDLLAVATQMGLSV